MCSTDEPLMETLALPPLIATPAPLMLFAPEEAVLPALNQSAHPIEFTEANPVDQETVEPRTV